MSMLHIQESEKTLDSEPANGTLYPGDLVVREAGGGVHPVDPANDSRVDGIVPLLDRGDDLRAHDEDWTDGATAAYELHEYTGDGTVSDDTDTVPIQPLSVSSVVIPYSVEDEALTEPSISKNAKAVVVNLSGSNGGSGRPRIVEEGYTADPDGGGSTTYNETNGNAIALGRFNQFQDSFEDGYGELAEVRLDPDILGN